MKRVNLGMSGGVDSSVAAYLLKEKGYEVCGITMRLCGDGESNVRASAEIAATLGIEHRSLDLRDEFKAKVMENFASAYEKGITPNPCVTCNKTIKFPYLDIGDEHIATGHYARIERDEHGRWLLRKSQNLAKDQSYFLYSLDRKMLPRIIFPLADYSKEEIREIASKLGFANAGKKDSQDICFVPDGNHADFIKDFKSRDYPEGDFVDMDGNVLGRHRGIIRYTVGQRKGLGLALKQPMYVYKIDSERNEVVLCESEELFSRELIACDFNWLSVEDPAREFRAKAKIRYRHKEADCSIYPLEDGRVKIIFDEPQRAITCGQSAVIYDDDIVVGGGIICTVSR